MLLPLRRHGAGHHNRPPGDDHLVKLTLVRKVLKCFCSRRTGVLLSDQAATLA
jgi:hypothetical protein